MRTPRAAHSRRPARTGPGPAVSCPGCAVSVMGARKQRRAYKTTPALVHREENPQQAFCHKAYAVPTALVHSAR
ncbi:hypothetical protein GCM10017674_08660 [Streptomyces gardneri]|nr:hypothetical protein GCM10017674_08660 [Streptomyces gardneri]